MSKVGLINLFDCSGGKLTADMSETISAVKVHDLYHQYLIADIRKIWDEWDVREVVQRDDCLQFDSFYGAFMAPYIGCYACSDAKQTMQAIDMDADGLVDWNEFMVYIKWALHEYPTLETVDDLLFTAFTKGIIPTMRDEKLKNKEDYHTPGPSDALQWCAASNGEVPNDALVGGWDAINIEPLYISRVTQDECVNVGKISPKFKRLFVPNAGREESNTSYEVLVNPGNQFGIDWVRRTNGDVHTKAVQAGRDQGGDIYLVHLVDAPITMIPSLERSPQVKSVSSYRGGEWRFPEQITMSLLPLNSITKCRLDEQLVHVEL